MRQSVSLHLCRYLWITIVYNLTYTVALYGLLLFYLGTHELLAPFKPLLKFALVKAVIFLSYWQGLFISIATGAGAIDTGGSHTLVQSAAGPQRLITGIPMFCLCSGRWHQPAKLAAVCGDAACCHFHALCLPLV